MTAPIIPLPKSGSEKPGALASNRKWLLIVLGLCAFDLSYRLAGAENGLWVPAVGIGIALTAWGGYWIVPILVVDSLLVTLLHHTDPIAKLVLDALFLGGQISLGWWTYHSLAGGSKRLDDPRSATVFLILVPGVVTALLSALQAAAWKIWPAETRNWAVLAGELWISRSLGTLVPIPILLVAASPWLVRNRWLKAERPGRFTATVPQDWSWGEGIETASLAIGNAIFALALVTTQPDAGSSHWPLWGAALLLVVWGSLRQGLRGGTLIAGTGATVALCMATYFKLDPAVLSPLQGNLLAQCSTALLVGASSGWIRASEARYRQVVGHIPVVLYSVHLPRSLRVDPRHAGKQSGRPQSDPDLATGPVVIDRAEVTLVSSASKQVFGFEPDSMLGPFRDWLERVLPADREIVIASVSQVCMQKQPVTCEYRLDPGLAKPASGQSSSWAVETFRWVRDTMAPHYTADGLLSGWDGVVEDITEQQALALKLKRTSSMLQALVSNLPAGVFFVQGQLGQPILVNARARQLLGQREDRAAGIAHLSQVYRLHRADGTLYPSADLPVAKALRLGTTHMVNDIVIHHPDGRRVPLITWAAPIDLSGTGRPDAAVWVLEDMSAMQQAESARRESENRLRQALEVLRQAKEKYQNLVETIPLIVLQLDLQGQITFLNTVAEQITGYPLTDLQRPGFWEGLLAEDDRTQFQTALARTRAGYHARVEFHYQGQDGSTKVGHALMQPFSQDGQIIGSTCLIVDMTLQRYLEIELQKAQQLEVVGRIAGGTVHDFNNLLTVMVGLAHMAQASVEPGHAAYDPLRRICETGEQAAHLAGQILTFGKQNRTEVSPLDLNAVVRHSLTLLQSVLSANIKVEAHLADGELLVLAEENQLKQVIVNLCFNARDAMMSGGTLVVRTENSGQSSIACGQKKPEGSSSLATDHLSLATARLTIQDTGEGMDEPVLAQIFDPFFSTKKHGTGLGLTMVRQIVEGFGGQVHASSQPRQGTTMEIILKSAGN